MKLLFDENLSRKLVHECPNCIPVQLLWRSSILLERPDREIWDFAKASGFTIATTDADFYELAAAFGPLPK